MNSGDLKSLNSRDLKSLDSGDLKSLNSGDLKSLNSGDLKVMAFCNTIPAVDIQLENIHKFCGDRQYIMLYV